MAEVLAAAAFALCLREGDYPGSDSPFNLNIPTISSAKSQRAIVTNKVTSAACPKLFFLCLKGAASQLFFRLSFSLFHPSHVLTHIDLFSFIISCTSHLFTMHLSKIKHSLLQTWEQALEGVGHSRSAQPFHRARSLKDYTNKTRLWIQEITNIDDDLRGTVQRETFVREELEALKAVRTPGSEGQIAKLEEELRVLLCLYIYESDLYDSIVALCPEDAFARGFLDWRRQHLSSDLRWDCARKDGCCGRECGCCEKPRRTTREKARHGHCTGECGCCRRARGRHELNPRERRHWRPSVNRIGSANFYTKHLEAGYVLGLVRDPNSKVSLKSS